MRDDLEVIDAIRRLVWSGFYSFDEVQEIVGQELFDPEEIDQGWLREEIDRQVAAKRTDERQWPKVTDCDWLDQAFGLLEQQHVIALQNAGYTQSDGLEDVTEAYHRAGGARSPIKGYCFYHGQDLERASMATDCTSLLATSMETTHVGSRSVTTSGGPWRPPGLSWSGTEPSRSGY